jgi:hypothetical protein
MKKDLQIRYISKKEAAYLLEKYHYLKDISKGFRSGVNIGGFLEEELVAVAIFTGVSAPETLKGAYGLNREEQEGFFELARLCVRPDMQKEVYNITSYFLSRALKIVRKKHHARAILSYADSDFHKGTIYAACNFKYYGLSASKKDFFFLKEDGSYEKHSRGPVKGRKGEWRPRSRKHRFLLTYDKNLKVKWQEQKWSVENGG